MKLKCRRCGNEFDFPYEVAQHNLRGYPTIYPKHCTDCFSVLNSEEPAGRVTYPGRGGERILQEYDPNWPKALYGTSQYLVYILSMIGTQGIEFYVGHTENIRDRLNAHRSCQVPSTRGKDPRLVWFCEAATRKEATRLEAELKGINDQNSDMIKEMVALFRNLAGLLDYSAVQ